MQGKLALLVVFSHSHSFPFSPNVGSPIIPFLIGASLKGQTAMPADQPCQLSATCSCARPRPRISLGDLSCWELRKPGLWPSEQNIGQFSISLGFPVTNMRSRSSDWEPQCGLSPPLACDSRGLGELHCIIMHLILS